MTANASAARPFLAWLAALALLLTTQTFAQQQGDPPARAATLTAMEGSVAFAPAGQTEWSDAVRNRPVTRGDRLWTDEGGRAELHLGTAVLHLDSRTFLGIDALDAQALQASLNEGSVIVRVRRLDAGENFEIDTPQLAMRAVQPGDFRIDVDPARGFTRVSVRSGTAMLYGANGGAVQMLAGQQMAFTGTDLAQAGGVGLPLQDSFDLWAAERNRAEDQSLTSRYVPRDVVGYAALDAYGLWSQDPDYGAVWFPRVTVADWAPYRYGRWDWIDPWGWTWVDDAPWGFAPFHYGRWAMVGGRWAWVPGPLGPRPVYAPALVAFVGGVSGGMGIGWYPLAPGESWQPFFPASPLYVRNVNRYLPRDRRWNDRPRDFYRRPDAFTSMRLDDFDRGRSVHDHWRRVNPADINRAQAIVPPRVSDPRRWWAEREQRAPRNVQRVVPQPSAQQQVAPAPAARPQPNVATPPLQPERRMQGGEQQRVRPGQDAPRRDQGMRVWPREQPQPQPLLQHQQRPESPRPQGPAQELRQRQQIQPQIQQPQMPQSQVQHQLLLQQQRQQQVQREEAMRQQRAAQEVQRQQAWQQREQQRAATPPVTLPMPQQPQSAMQPMPQQPAVQAPQPRHEARERERPQRNHDARGQQPGGGDEAGRGQGRGQRFN